MNSCRIPGVVLDPKATRKNTQSQYYMVVENLNLVRVAWVRRKSLNLSEPQFPQLSDESIDFSHVAWLL